MNVINRVLFAAIILLFSYASSADDAPQPSWAEVLPDLQGDPIAGREAAESCDVCHGDEGFSEHRYYPVLAGQINKYLVFQLHRYRSRGSLSLW